MPFGISSAPEIFQRMNHLLIEGLEGTEVIADDFLVYGKGVTIKEATKNHDRCLQAFLDRCRQAGVILSKSKLQLRKSTVPFIGHVASDRGLEVAPEKVSAILNMPAPTDVAGVRRLLGMVQYLAKFMPGLSDMTLPLRELTKSEVEFTWQSTQKDAFEKVKQAVSSTPVLKYYSATDELTIQCDASSTGLGAAILQQGQPVAFASRALTPTEQRYAQIEKECLAIVFACKKFHMYVFGRHVRVQSDHQPLESIMKKPLEAAPARLQRMLLQLQKYDLDVVYKKGREMLVADTLSRAVVNSEESLATVNALRSVSECEPTLTLNVRPDNCARIKEAVAKDPAMQRLKEFIELGWPEHRAHCCEIVRAYFNVRDELSSVDGLLYKGHRLIIPKSLRPEMLRIGHEGHVGQEGMLRRMREAIYWPGMSTDAKAMVSQCDSCLTHTDTLPKEEMISHEVTGRPWSKVGMDLFELDHRRFLLCVDYFSNFIEIARLKSITAASIIHSTSDIFARHGVPDVVMSDNGKQFDCQEFKEFALQWGFDHQTSSPHFPKSNGKAENAVKTVKRLLKKCQENGDNEFLALLNWRNTPSEGLMTSPAQRLMGRRYRTLLPCTSESLTPAFDVESDRIQLEERKSRQAKYYNRNTKRRPDLKIGQTVRMKQTPTSDKYIPAKVLNEVAPRSYTVQVGEKVYRRNKQLLRPTKEALESELEPLSLRETQDHPPEMQPEDPQETAAEVYGPGSSTTGEQQTSLRRSTRKKLQTVKYGFDTDI